MTTLVGSSQNAKMTHEGSAKRGSEAKSLETAALDFQRTALRRPADVRRTALGRRTYRTGPTVPDLTHRTVPNRTYPPVPPRQSLRAKRTTTRVRPRSGSQIWFSASTERR